MEFPLLKSQAGHMPKSKHTIIDYLREKTGPASLLILLLLLSADFMFVVIHFLYKLTHPDPYSLFHLTIDRSYAEIFQYIKYFWIIILFIYIVRSTRINQYFSWILVFVFFFFNDAFQLHREIGRFIAINFNLNPPFHLAPHDVGSLVYFIISGVLLSGILFWSYRRGNQNFKICTIDLGIFMLFIVFFGVVVDAVHAAFNLYGMGLSILEDSGEMLMVSLILWYVFTLSVSRGTFNLNLPGLIAKLVSRS